MNKARTYFFLVMGTLILGAWFLMAVKVWPINWLRYRAEMGDQMAIAEMRDRALAAHDTEAYANWASQKRGLTEEEAVFMDAPSRKSMKLLFKAQEKETPLLDVLEK